MKKAIVLLSLLMMSLTHAEGLRFAYKDWEIACDNTRKCYAVGYSKAKENHLASILFTRAAGEQEKITAHIKFADYHGEITPNTSLLKIEKTPQGIVSFKGAESAKLSDQQTSAILDAIKSNKQIQLISGQRQWLISNEGASIVLAKMDQMQGRLGTTSAVTKKGNKTEVLSALKLPIVYKEPVVSIKTKVWNKRIDWRVFKKNIQTETFKERCDLNSDYFKFEPTVVAVLNDEKLLVSGQCWEGAYNEGFAYWVMNKQQPYQPKLITSEGTDFEDSEIISNQKGRGLGDCWSYKVWVWDGDTFVKSLDQDTGMCRTIQAGGTWALPTYRTVVKEKS